MPAARQQAQALPSAPNFTWDRSNLMATPSTPSSRFASDVMAGVRGQSWVEQVTGRRLEGGFAEALKDGQGLCHLINKIRPGTITKIETSTSPFKQMANISAFIHGCKALGVRETALFETLDLYNEKRLPQVARCLFSLSEVVRKTMPGFPGPHLSAPDRPDVDPAIKAVVDIAKGKAPAPAWGLESQRPATTGKIANPSARGRNAAATVGKNNVSVSGSPSRSVHLTLPNAGNSTENAGARCLSPAAHAAGQLTYGIYEGGGTSTPLATPSGSRLLTGAVGTNVDGVVDGVAPHGPQDRAGGLGDDGPEKKKNKIREPRRVLSREEEIRRRKQAVSRVDAEMEVALWIEGVTGVTFPGKFWSSLKDGVLLCQVINAIQPGLIPTINTTRAPFPEMENITAFLTACRSLGVAEHSLFDTKDLHEKRDLQAVVRCLHVLGATVQSTVPTFRGPFLGKKSEACSVVNAKGLRDRLGKGPGAHGGLRLGGLTQDEKDVVKEVAPTSPRKDRGQKSPLFTKDQTRTNLLKDEHEDGDATVTVTPAESPMGNRGLFNPAGASDSAAGSAALEAVSAQLAASQRSLSPVTRKGLLARVSSPLRGRSPLGRKWRRSNSRSREDGADTADADALPPLILEDVPEGDVPEEASIPVTVPAAKVMEEAEAAKEKSGEGATDKKMLEATPGRDATIVVKPKPSDGHGSNHGADGAAGDGEAGNDRGAKIASREVLPDHAAEHVDDDSAFVAAQIQSFVESNTRMPWRVDGDMYESLRDGWQLGLLANSLRPGAVRRVHNSIMPGKHVHNIVNFLTACRRMGVASAMIFDVPDLYSKRNLTKVSRTLLALRALAADPGFARARRPNSSMEASLLTSAATKAAFNVGIGQGIWTPEAR